MATVKAKRKPKSPVTMGGVVLTEERIEELADEAERGYDLSKFTVQGPGRPSLGERGTSPRLSFLVAPETFRAARRKADQEGVSLSEVAREAVRRYVGA